MVFVPLHYQSISLSIHGYGAFQRPLFKTGWVYIHSHRVSRFTLMLSRHNRVKKECNCVKVFFPFRDFSYCLARLSFSRPDLLNILCHTCVAPTSSSKPCLVPTCGTTLLLHLVQLYYSSWVPTPAIISSTIKQWLPSEANATLFTGGKGKRETERDLEREKEENKN